MADEHKEEAGDQAEIEGVVESKVENQEKNTEIVREDDETKVKTKKGKTNVLVKKSTESLLDEPVLVEGKRQRHAVERLAASSPPSRKSNVDAFGSGVLLGDIEFVNVGISKAHNETLKSLHRLCFGTSGTATSRKRDLRRFNGYAFDGNSSEFEKKKVMAMKLTTTEVNSIAKILGSERGHTKEETVMNVLQYLQKPEDKGKKVPTSKKRRSTSKTTKGAKRSKIQKNEKKRSVEKKLKSKEEEKLSADGKAGQSEEEDEGSSDEGAKESRSDIKNPTKSGAEKPKRPKKIVVSNIKNPSGKESKTWGDGGPTNEEIETAIDEILRTVDLVNCTMKQMCERIAEKFPNLDMTVYKTPLKDCVKAALERLEDS